MTLCCFAVVMDDERVAWCPLCGAEFCNVLALNEHFTIYHEGKDGLIPSENTLFDGAVTDEHL